LLVDSASELLKECAVPRLSVVAVLSLLLCALAPAFAAERNLTPGCRLAANDPLRAEIDQMMREGAAYEEQQRLTLEEKVRQLGRTRGWTKAEEDHYLQRLVAGGINASFDQTLAVAAAFIQICEEQTDGYQRSDAVRLFREFYVVEERQWQSLHQLIDSEIARAEQETGMH
jgi:hypothetical protein